MILDDDIRMLGLDGLCQRAEHGGLSDTGHILQANLLGACGYQLISNTGVILHGVYGRRGNAERGLGRHATFLSPFDAWDDVTCIVQTAEDTRNIHSLRVLHLIHQGAHIVRHGIHTQGIQATIEHVGLNTCLVEWFAECPYSSIGVLTRHEVHLLKGTAIGLHTTEAAHVDDDWRNAL